MSNMHVEELSRLPNEMRIFSIASASTRSGPRLGALHLPGRQVTHTPNYVGNTSRGVVPHFTPDMQHKHSKIKVLYMGLEDFIERAPKETPPILKAPVESGQSPLRRYAGQNEQTAIVLALRRLPHIVSPNQNSNSAIAISTSVGFSQYSVEDYISAVRKLKPDIVVGPGDVAFLPTQPSQKRAEKAADRTVDWMRMLLRHKEEDIQTKMEPAYQVFAPVLPLPWEQQRWYSEFLGEDDKLPFVAGLAVYDADNFHEPPEQLSNLPRLALTQPSAPSEVLRQIWLGLDVFVLPFIGAATDAGIALDFSFPALSAPNGSQLVALGFDCWDSKYATDLSPLKEHCECYTCQKHHRAFLQHLLHAKEMLGWVLLQIHNHHVVDEFFAGIRNSVEKGTFEHDVEEFNKYYERDLPEKTGQGPRVRGYQRKSEGPGESKVNQKAYDKLDDTAKILAEADPPSSSADASDLEEHGLGKVEKA